MCMRLKTKRRGKSHPSFAHVTRLRHSFISSTTPLLLPAMKTIFSLCRPGLLLAFLSTLLPVALTSCQNLPPAEQMPEAQREAYVEHRKWDFEAEKRKEIDAENRR